MESSLEPTGIPQGTQGPARSSSARQWGYVAAIVAGLAVPQATPAVMDFASVMISGSSSKPSHANSVPVRPQPHATSSAITRVP